MSDIVRISVHLSALIISGYVLMGVDFSKFLRKGQQDKGQLLYVLTTLAMAYLVAQFLLNLSISFVY